MGGNRGLYLEHLQGPGDRKAAANIPPPLEYGTALLVIQEISLQCFLSEVALECRHFSHYNDAAG